ncbi:MAG TPA: Gfo/Idh/MocA family oxidoreductase [Woeseiaceae bacterium]
MWKRDQPSERSRSRRRVTAAPPLAPLATAVIGVGRQGRRHAQKLAALQGSRLVAVVDIDAARAREVAGELGVTALSDCRELPGEVSAAIVATPTSTHYEVARSLLDAGIHVLIEKPMTTAMEHARALVEVANGRRLVLQVGHLERFNPVVLAMADRVSQPQFIESVRVAPYTQRALDVSVVLDLMIHDIDLIHTFVKSPMQHVDAVGRAVFTDNIDVANARITFVNGCVANVTSSRISSKTERTLRIFQPDSYLSADLRNMTLTHYLAKASRPVTRPADLEIRNESFGPGDALLEQAQAFLDSVAGGPPPLANGRVAMHALETATLINRIVAAPRAS